MLFNYLLLIDVKFLKVILFIYDYKSYYDCQQVLVSQYCLDVFDGVVFEYEDCLYQGMLVWGCKIVIWLKESYFVNEGDMFLFVLVFNELFVLSCSINSFYYLVVYGVEYGEIY